MFDMLYLNTYIFIIFTNQSSIFQQSIYIHMTCFYIDFRQYWFLFVLKIRRFDDDFKFIKSLNDLMFIYYNFIYSLRFITFFNVFEIFFSYFIADAISWCFNKKLILTQDELLKTSTIKTEKCILCDFIFLLIVKWCWRWIQLTHSFWIKNFNNIKKMMTNITTMIISTIFSRKKLKNFSTFMFINEWLKMIEINDDSKFADIIFMMKVFENDDNAIEKNDAFVIVENENAFKMIEKNI